MSCVEQDLRAASEKIAVLHSKLRPATNLFLGRSVEALQSALELKTHSDITAFAKTVLEDLYGAICKTILPAEKMVSPITFIELLLSPDNCTSEVRYRQIRYAICCTTSPLRAEESKNTFLGKMFVAYISRGLRWSCYRKKSFLPAVTSQLHVQQAYILQSCRLACFGIQDLVTGCLRAKVPMQKLAGNSWHLQSLFWASIQIIMSWKSLLLPF